MKLLILYSSFYLPAQTFESMDQMTKPVGESGLVPEVNMFGGVGLIQISAVKDKIGVAEACPPKLVHRSNPGSTDRTISLDAPLHKSNSGT